MSLTNLFLSYLRVGYVFQLSEILGDHASAFDCYNRLGEAYMALGDRPLAMKMLRLGIGGPELQDDDVPGSVTGLNRCC